jgi:hypothetical protein
MKNKSAEIRKNISSHCPFGLPIPFGCKHAGNCILKMAPTNILGKETSEYQVKNIGSANTKLLATNLLNSTVKPKQCEYAGKILEQNDAVECSYNDSHPKEHVTKALTTSPFYPSLFNTSIQGLFTVPLGLYSDYNISRNLWFGSMSLQGSEKRDLIKFAIEETIKNHNNTNSSE